MATSLEDRRLIRRSATVFDHEAQMSRRSQQADGNDRNSTELVEYEHQIDQAQQEVISQTQRPLSSRRIPHLTGGISMVHWH